MIKKLFALTFLSLFFITGLIATHFAYGNREQPHHHFSPAFAGFPIRPRWSSGGGDANLFQSNALDNEFFPRPKEGDNVTPTKIRRKTTSLRKRV